MSDNFSPLVSHGPASKKASPGDHSDSDWSFSARDAKDKIKQVIPTTVIPTARRTSPFLILCHKNIDSSSKFCLQINCATPSAVYCWRLIWASPFIIFGEIRSIKDNSYVKIFHLMSFIYAYWSVIRINFSLFVHKHHTYCIF